MGNSQTALFNGTVQTQRKAEDRRTYRPSSISWRIRHKTPLPGESRRSVGWRETRPVTRLSADAEVIHLEEEGRAPPIGNLRSSLVR